MKKILSWVVVAMAVAGVAFFVLKKWNALPCDYVYMEYQEDYSPSGDTTNVTHWYMTYPEFSRRFYTDAAIDSINASILASVSEDGKSMEEMAEEFMADYKRFWSDYKKYWSDGKEEIRETEYIPSWYFNSYTYVLINGSKLIVTEMETDTYMGGAHGMYGSYFSNYDVKSGRKLTLEDVFSDTTAVKEQVTKYFLEQYSLDKDKTLEEQGFFVDGEYMNLTSNFALLPEGVLFTYNVYEIAPYAFGKCEVTVPYSAVREVMTYSPDFKKADVFKQEILPVW